MGLEKLTKILTHEDVAGNNANENKAGDNESESSKKLEFVAQNKNRRRPSIPGSYQSQSEVDSRHSDSSNETEEDVCFPMDRENTGPMLDNGIDFEELQQFIDHKKVTDLNISGGSIRGSVRSGIDGNSAIGSVHGSVFDNNNKSSSAKKKIKVSKAAAKYIPKWLQHRDHHRQAARVRRGSHTSRHSQQQPDATSSRSSSDTSYSKNGPQVGFSEANNKVEHTSDEFVGLDGRYDDGGHDVHELQNVNFMSQIPHKFSLFTSESDETIHGHDLNSLTKPGQSIKELFQSSNNDPSFTWWLNCCCASDDEIKVLAKTFNIHPLTAEDIRMAEDREKVEFFKDYYFVTFHSFNSDSESEDFLEPIYFYMVVMKNGFLSFHNAPVNHGANVRRRIRQLRDYISLTSDWMCYALIDDITDSFLPVIEAIDYETDVIEASVFSQREMDFSVMLHRIGLSRNKVMTLIRLLTGKADVLKMMSKRCHDPVSVSEVTKNASTTNMNMTMNMNANSSTLNMHAMGAENAPTSADNSQPRADIALYLGDIQDHIITMYQNLTSYEKILSRSYTNYLAQLQVESFNSNNKVTNILSKVTLIGTIIVPMNIITGLFGMNVEVPGAKTSGLGWWFGIMSVMLFFCIVGFLIANWWINRIDAGESNENDDSRSFITRFMRRGKAKRSDNTRSIVSTNPYM